MGKLRSQPLNNMNSNFQHYEYETILHEVKELLLPTIIDRIIPKDLVAVNLDRNILADIIYSQIMALGFNNRDINAALNDLMPTRNPLIYPGSDETDAVNMAIHLAIIDEDYSDQVKAFQVFHQMTKELRPRDEVIRNVKRQVLHLLL